MSTYACFIFLLAIGLTVQKSEFEIDFEKMVNTVRLKDTRTLLKCTEKCSEVKEAECKCRSFTCSVGDTFLNCIKKGLGDLKLNETGNIIARLKKLDINSEDKRILTDQKLAHKMSPKSFLDYIVGLYQKSNAQKSG